ncbi:glutamate synthase domain-containing protein 2 [Thiogranum longum]|uniref:Glutamate synthase domain-containing protein 2 n=1 Tax=Thiogranum longum TaxID=1537524 RepID=A0A4R1HAU1_9GAMM|nr:FMN-binding glutamate synthase family protein [Thiogranum longum]TCK17711.1 glutamate synthase domain-containing protein 2 [Thiogranum longum]
MLVRNQFKLLSIIVPLATLVLARFWPPAWWLFAIILPLIALGIYDLLQRKHTILRIYPVIGHMRFIFEYIRPEIQQYFVESDTNGQPVNREFRALVYQRAKGVRDTRPFGTVFDVYRNGYEWVNHSLAPKAVHEKNPRVLFGSPDCLQPYAASPLNISAMSFGALSKNAIMALNKGARIDGFAHNSGEGGLSPYHLRHGGDLIWQIGTGYFGCRNANGEFDEALFTEKAGLEVVKMIEIKLSQGAKPGHGGILPAVKLTQEIADIRHVPMGQDVVSPPAHTAFSTPTGLLEFVARLRELSGGKPVGFKLCIGRKSEFLSICKAMLETGIAPDFITVDGAEGGTGAAPIELTNSVGTPLRDGLIFIHNALIGTGLRDRIRIIASGKVMSAFHMLRLMALGADTINSARAMMFALGCIQSRHCNQDTCPTGVATQNPARYKALDVEDKSVRVANYHASMIKNLTELVAAAGLDSLNELRPWHINRRVDGTETRNYAELYPCISNGSLLSDSGREGCWQTDWNEASANHW